VRRCLLRSFRKAYALLVEPSTLFSTTADPDKPIRFTFLELGWGMRIHANLQKYSYWVFF
jgi:hypothetical protein